MLGKIKSMITDLAREIRLYFPLKGAILNLTGNGAANPVVSLFCNVASVVWNSTGVYTITISQTTMYGINVLNSSSISCTWVISPTVNSDAFKVDLIPGVGVITMRVYELTVSGARVVRTPVNLLSSDKVYISLQMSGGVDLPPA